MYSEIALHAVVVWVVPLRSVYSEVALHSRNVVSVAGTLPPAGRNLKSARLVMSTSPSAGIALVLGGILMSRRLRELVVG